MKSTIYLIRHGITEGNLKRWYYGWADIPLADEGIENLKALVNEGIYPKLNEAEYFTSGMIRTEETLNILFGDIEHKKIELLKEMNFGEFEQKQYEEIKDDSHYQEWLNDTTGWISLPNGESKLGFFERVKEGLKVLIAEHRLRELANRHNGKSTDTVVVCHGGVIACIMVECFKKEMGEFSKWIPQPGRGYKLNIEDGIFTSYEAI